MLEYKKHIQGREQDAGPFKNVLSGVLFRRSVYRLNILMSINWPQGITAPFPVSSVIKITG